MADSRGASPEGEGRKPPPAPRPGGGNAFTRKLGPLPVWGWGLIGVGAIGLLYYLHKRSASSSTSGAAAPATSAAPMSAMGTLGAGGGSSGSGAAGGLGTFLGGQYGGGGSTQHVRHGGAFPVPPLTTPTAPATTPVAATSLPTPAAISQGVANMGGAQNLNQAQLLAISQYEQPQNQPGTNALVSAAPVTGLPSGGSVGAPSGVGQRFINPEGYAFTYG